MGGFSSGRDSEYEVEVFGKTGTDVSDVMKRSGSVLVTSFPPCRPAIDDVPAHSHQTTSLTGFLYDGHFFDLPSPFPPSSRAHLSLRVYHPARTSSAIEVCIGPRTKVVSLF